MIKIKSEKEFKSVIGNTDDSAVAVLFTSSGCAPCERLKTKLKTLQKKIFEVSSGDLRDLCVEQNVRSAPTFRIYKSGVISLHVVGDDPSIINSIEEYGVKDAQPVEAEGVIEGKVKSGAKRFDKQRK